MVQSYFIPEEDIFEFFLLVIFFMMLAGKITRGPNNALTSTPSENPDFHWDLLEYIVANLRFIFLTKNFDLF